MCLECWMGTFTWLLSPQVPSWEQDYTCHDLRAAPLHVSSEISTKVTGSLKIGREIIPVKDLTWFITQSNYLLSIGCRYYYCSCCFIEVREHTIEYRLWVMGRHLKQGRDVRSLVALDNCSGEGSTASQEVTGLPSKWKWYLGGLWLWSCSFITRVLLY